MTNFTLSGAAYDKLKKTTQLVLPALGSLYFGLAQIWNFPAGEEVVGSIALLTTFCGTVLGVSSKNYQPDELAGDFVIDTTPDGQRTMQFQLDKDPEEVIKQKLITFKMVDTRAQQDDQFWNRPFDLDRPSEHDRPAR